MLEDVYKRQGQDCVLTDDSDPEAPGRTLYAGDLLGLGDEVFSPQALSLIHIV